MIVGLSVCLFNKRQNGSTDRAKSLCRTWHDPGKGLKMHDRNFKNSLHQNSVLIKF